MNIEIISGSPRQQSVTYRLALFLKECFTKNTSHHVDIVDVREWPLPQFQQEVYSSAEKAPGELKPLVKRIFAADAFIIVTPEYNGSYTPSLKNLFDHFPKQMHKPFGIVTASTGGYGGIRASQQLLLLALALFGIPSPYMLVVPAVDKKFDPQGNLLDESFSNSIHTFTTEFLWLAERLKK